MNDIAKAFLLAKAAEYKKLGDGCAARAKQAEEDAAEEKKIADAYYADAAALLDAAGQ